MSSKADVIRNFARQTGKHQNGSIGRNGQTNIFYQGLTLYSFGHHFPLAVQHPTFQDSREASEDNQHKFPGFGSGIFHIINGDKYSRSTSAHQGNCISYLTKNVQIPFSALVQAWNWAAERNSGMFDFDQKYDEMTPNEFLKAQGEEGYAEFQRQSEARSAFYHSDEYRAASYRFESMKVRSSDGLANRLAKGELEIVAFCKDTYEYRCEDKDGKALSEWMDSASAAWGIHTENGQCPSTATHKQRHRLGSVLIRIGSYYFLSSFDEIDRSNYFLCQIPGEPKTIAEAYENLKPYEVRHAEACNNEVLRQGDWFFIKANPEGRIPRPELTKVRLGGNSGTHVVTRSRTLPGNDPLAVVSGIVRHSPLQNWRKPEHRSLKLGDGKSWWIPIKNTSLAGWSAVGNVD